MGLFDKFKRRFSKSEDNSASVDEEDPFEDHDSLRKFQENNNSITEEVMDVLLSQNNDVEVKPSELVISEYDAGEADLLELENEILEDNSIKNVVVHESFDEIDEHLEGAKIIGDISEEVSFDSVV